MMRNRRNLSPEEELRYMKGTCIFAVIVFFFTACYGLMIMSSSDKIDAVVTDKKYTSAGRGGVHYLYVTYTENEEEQTKCLIVNTSFLYSKGSHAAILHSRRDGDIRLLTDLLHLPAVSLLLIIVSAVCIIRKMRT